MLLCCTVLYRYRPCDRSLSHPRHATKQLQGFTVSEVTGNSELEHARGKKLKKLQKSLTEELG
jgi:hypothetical protein